MNPFRPFIAALCWLIRVEPEPLTAEEKAFQAMCEEDPDGHSTAGYWRRHHKAAPPEVQAALRAAVDAFAEDDCCCCKAECSLCETQPTEIEVTIGECPGEGNRVDDAAKLLDNGWVILLFRRQLGSYTARAIRPFHLEADMQYDDTKTDVVTTTNFTISKALYRLTEKVTTGRIVGSQDTEEL